MLGIFRPYFALVPFSVSRAKEQIGGGRYIGYAIYRVFGFRVAQIQETKPWE